MNESVETKLKHLLKKAWRERWSDLMWGVYVKEVLPSGSNGDKYNLAECILKQALIGPSPNSLLLSYLQHSLHMQIVSYCAVFKTICHHGILEKSRCLLELLRLLEQSLKYVSCSGATEDCAALAAATLQLEAWLWEISSNVLKKSADVNNHSNENMLLSHYSATLLNTLYEDQFLVALLYVGRCCSSDQYATLHLTSLVNQTENNLKQLSSSNFNVSVPEPLPNAISQYHSFEQNVLKEATSKPSFESSLCSDVHVLISLEALLHPTADTYDLTKQLEIILKLKGYSLTQLYSEILRACCLGLSEDADSPGELRWAVFTFLKLPALFLRLHRTLYGLDVNTPIVEPSTEVAGAFERLLCYPGLLETTDAKCQCNVVEHLLNEVKTRTALLSEWHVTSILSKRETLSRGGLKLEATNTQNATLVLRAEPTVASILKTLDTDYAKNQETLLKVLSHLLSGQSFELILNAATGTGKLKSFATKLVRFNEANRQPGTGDPGKPANVRALLFDISFLMLCRIAQMYGTEVILNGESGGETFFEQWAVEWLKPGKAPDLSLSQCDSMLTDQLLKTLTSGESDLRSGTFRWHEACLHVPAVIREILSAYESQLVSDDDVERILDSLRSQMCCLSVCAAAWLRFFIDVQPTALKAKPTSMLQHLMSPLNQEDSKEHYRERAVLMYQIIRSLAKSDTGTKDIHQNNPESLDHQFSSMWNKFLSKGWADHNATLGIHKLYSTGGPTWLATALIRAIVKEQSSDKRERCVEGAFSLAHMDVEGCTVSLASKILPLLLTRSSMLASDEEIGGPGGAALAKFVTLVFTAALNKVESYRGEAPKSGLNLGGKRAMGWDTFDVVTYQYIPSKKLILTDDDLGLMRIAPSAEDENKTVHHSVAKLLLLMARAAKEGILTPQLEFTRYFVKHLVEMTTLKTRDVMKPLLYLIPPALPFYLLAIWPKLLTDLEIAKLLAHPGDETEFGKFAARIICTFKSRRAVAN